MADINHVVLVGRLTRDAELRYTNSGLAIANMSLAVNRRVKRDDVWQDEPGFFRAVLFGRQAEAVSQYLVKGKQIGIQGELRQNRWEQDGQPRSRVEIAINNLQLLGGRGRVPEQPIAETQDYSQGVAPKQEPPTAEDFDDDIPF